LVQTESGAAMINGKAATVELTSNIKPVQK
jgi:hypothetical protein